MMASFLSTRAKVDILCYTKTNNTKGWGDMKKSIIKIVFSFFTTVVLCAQLVSCQRSVLPLTSDNFPKDFVNSFFENYRLVDPQLAYVTASPWEVEIKVDSDNKMYLHF